MAEIRCSMCSKMNPDTRDECQFCGARLKPLTLPPTNMLDLPSDWNKPAAAEKTKPTPPAENDDDWLRRLQGDAASTPLTDEPTSTPAEDASDWLARLKAQEKTSSPQEKPQTEDANDWLTRLKAQDVSPADLPPSEAEPVEHSGKTDQWLARLGASDNVDLSVPAASEQDGAADDWLSQIRTEAETPPPVVKEAPKTDSGLLRRARTGPLPPFKPPQPPTPPPSASTLPSWLAPSSESDSEIPDWIKGSPSDPSALTPLTDSALPAWLTESSIPTTESATPPDDSLDWLAASQPGAPKDSALPDWMSTPSAPTAQPVEQDGILLNKSSTQPVEQDGILLNKSSTPGASKDSELPEWMTPTAQTVEQDGILLNKPESATPESLPDWLSSSAPSQSSPFLPAASSPSPAPATNELEWLSSLTSESPVTSTDSMSDWLNSKPASSPASESLDWMSSLNSPAALPPSAPSESADSLDWMSGTPPKISSNVAVKGVTGWLSSPDSKPKTSPLKSDIGSGDEPNWLSGGTTQSPVPSTPSLPAVSLSSEERNLLESSSSKSSGSSGLPDWLEALRPTGLDSFPSMPSTVNADAAASLVSSFSAPAALPIEPSIQPIVKDLSSGTLPSWLKAMKPVDEHAPQEDMGMEHEERAGPLAGMRGTLLAESVMTLAGTPGQSVERLVVTEAQAKHVEIFARIIREETEEVVPRVRKNESFKYAVDRLLIAVVMMALVVLPSLAGFNVVKPPVLFSKDGGGGDFYIYVDKQLSTKQIVLVALDYDVGYSNELNPAVKAVVFHLVKRNVRVAMVSSSPLGAMMAQEILIQAAREAEVERGVKDTRFADDYGKKFIHLGYIPGGAIGLQNFASYPPDVVSNDFVLGKPLWEQEALKDLKTVGDFGLIVVAASSAETAQGWIEQVGTPTKAKIAVITSASSAPLIYPYYSSKQVIGVLAKLPDAIVYSRTVNRKMSMTDFSPGWTNYLLPELNSARVNDLWQGYALGSNGIAVILVIGALVSTVMLFVIRRREQEEAAKAIVTAPRPKAAMVDKPLFKKTVRADGKAPATKKAAAKVGAKKIVKKKK